MKGLSTDAGWKNATTRFSDAFGLALLFWPFVSAGLFTVVPRHYANLYMDFFNLIWNVFLSFVANKKPGAEVLSWPLLYRKIKSNFTPINQ